MIVTKENIQDFIPQRPPFVMIDNLLEATGDHFKTDFKVLPDNIFVENGKLREFAMIENIAQSSSVGMAKAKKYPSGKKPEGYLGAVSKLKLYGLPAVDSTIYTVVTLIVQLENMFLLKGETWFNDKKLMECELKLVGV